MSRTAAVMGMLCELEVTRCRCGNVKRARQTFCRGCFGRLPRGMQTDLYKRFGEGYEEAYRAAVKFLGFAPLPWEAK